MDATWNHIRRLKTWGVMPPRYLLAILLFLVSAITRINADDEIPPSPAELPARTASSAEQLLQNKPLSSLVASTKPTVGDVPRNQAAMRLSEIGMLFDTIDDSRPWMIATQCEWDAPATRHLTLFFEEPNLERVGYTQRYVWDSLGLDTPPVVAEIVQPAVSAAYFLGNLGLVPYKCGVESPFEPIYTLGVDRPGSPVVYREHLIPLSLTGAALEAGVVSTLVFAIH